MEFSINLNDKKITVIIQKKRGLKNTYLRIVDKNVIQINSNLFFSKNDAIKLINKKEDWIEKSFLKLQRNILNENDFLFFGVVHKNLDNRNLDDFYKKEAKKIIPLLVDKFSKKMNLFPKELKYRKNKRTWGSCNYKNTITFNYLLVKFPLEVIEYVVIHELAHIKEKNHSKKFWDLVEEYCPDYKKRVKIFKSFL